MMRLKELAKTIFAKIKPEITVKMDQLTVTGPSQDRGFLLALGRGEREPFMVSTLLDQVKPGSVFLDIGGHLGQYALLAADKLRRAGSGQVYVFEPNPRSNKYLERNIAQNNLGSSITLEKKCVSAKAEMITLFSDELQSDYTSMIAGADGSSQRQAVQVEAIVIDQYFANKRAPDVVKIDVEGAELIVLSGMKQMLEKAKPVLFIESNGDALKRAGQSAEQLYAQLRQIYSRIDIVEDEEQRIVPLTDAKSLNERCVNLFCRP